MSVQKVITNIQQELLVRRVAALEALNRYYAAMAINYFLSVQPPAILTPGKFWDNKTAQAATRMFANAFKDGKNFGWFIAHGVDYGVYLEGYRKDGSKRAPKYSKHAAIWPIVKRYAGRYLEDVKKIFEG